MVNVNDECLIFYIFRLRTMTESTWKILKLDWKTPGFFSSKRVETLFTELVMSPMHLSFVMSCEHNEYSRYSMYLYSILFPFISKHLLYYVE